MTPYLSLAFLALVVALQTSVMPHAALGTVKPLLPVLAVVTWALVRGRTAAAWWAVVLGLMLDVLSPAPAGTYTLPMLAALLVAAAGRSRLFPTTFILPGAVAAAATIAFTLTQRLVLDLRLAESVPGYGWHAAALMEDLVPVTMLSLLWLPVLFFPLRFVARHAGPARMEWER